ncbi:MAG TPA: GNAT family N-acetyltransferase, partial [Thermoflexales bacterium]|nr:GNAT family N-acetyltransferase [Thermoflexales bacterium]
SHRRELIKRNVLAGNCYIALADGVLGYVMLEYSFYGNGFVSLLYVSENARRMGAGSALMRHAESVCQTDKLFTSTNMSNAIMQALLDKLGYALSGVLHELDEGDPELVFFKKLR